jgi:hypothetical protein
MKEGGIHDLVTATLAQMGLGLPSIRTILIQKGYFAGYKYHFEGGYAVWRVEMKEIEVYDDGGKLLKRIGPATGGEQAA